MKYRKVRIAWSVIWALLAVLFVALWVRSYWWEDVLSVQIPVRAWSAWTLRGKAAIMTGPQGGPFKTLKSSYPADEPVVSTGLRKNEVGFGFGGVNYPGGFFWTVPCWFPVVMCATVMFAPWIGSIPRRFSLRTMLVATTLVAVVLGLIVWATR